MHTTKIETPPIQLFPLPRRFLIPLAARLYSRVLPPSRPSEFQYTQSLVKHTNKCQSVVFVHGLHGHRKKTWTKDNVCWPGDLLSKEISFSHIRVLTFGYDANVINTNGSVSLNSLFDHSLDLLQDLSRVRRHDAVSTIFFFSKYHSMFIFKPEGSADHFCCTFSRWDYR
jgi:hypothetical protein